MCYGSTGGTVDLRWLGALQRYWRLSQRTHLRGCPLSAQYIQAQVLGYNPMGIQTLVAPQKSDAEMKWVLAGLEVRMKSEAQVEVQTKVQTLVPAQLWKFAYEICGLQGQILGHVK